MELRDRAKDKDHKKGTQTYWKKVRSDIKQEVCEVVVIAAVPACDATL